MRKFGLIGYPLGHSFSKKYFTEKFIAEDISDCQYENYPLKHIDELEKLIGEEPFLQGLNVTIPYKNDVIKYLDFVENEAKAIGAVNVVKIKREDGKLILHGYNSDVKGIRDSISPFLNDGMKQAIILGTGGSSKAVKYIIDNLGFKVILVSRTKREGVLNYSNLTDDLIENTDIIINTTPLGMFPNVDSKPDINYKALSSKHVLFDLVYNPEITLFMKEGKERGCSVINGLTMLYSQAERSWEIWNNDSL